MFIILIVVAVIIFIIVIKKRKVPKLGEVCCITGGVKTGKSTLTLYLARRKYKSNLFKWKIRKLIAKIRKREEPEKPLFYSNIPLGYEYVPLTKEIFLREERMAYKSVVFCDEASLIADSQDWRDTDINEQLKLFNKLFGHETQGGSLFYDTHVMRDVHYAIKRCMNSYLWIHHAIKWIPFFYFCQVREMFFSEEGEAVNLIKDDAEDKLKWICVPKSTWKKFDCYCYSVLTDHLTVANKVTTAKDKKELKTDKIIEIGKKRGTK